MSRPKKYPILLSEAEVQKLKSMLRSKNASKTILRRCQILLELDENNPNQLTQIQIASTFGVCKATISNIVLDYATSGSMPPLPIRETPTPMQKVN